MIYIQDSSLNILFCEISGTVGNTVASQDENAATTGECKELFF
jgi:hypothetical protein